MHRIRQRLAVVFVVGLLAACGSGDDTSDGDAAAATTDDGSSEAGDTTSDGDDASDDDATSDDDTSSVNDDASDDASTANDDRGDDDMIVIDDFDDIPDECVDLMADFLREIEPSVSDIDWENVTIAELEAMGSELDVPTDDFDRRSAESGCDRYDIGADNDQSLEFAIRVAEREAPGTVGWLRFIADMSSVGDVVGDVTGGDDAGTSGLPGNCDEAKQLLLDKANEYGNFNNVPAGEIGTLTMAVSNLAQVCTMDELQAIYEDPVIVAFLDG